MSSYNLMTPDDPARPNDATASSYALPQWDLPRRQRLRLDRRARTVRRALIASGLIGAVLFSAVAGYETKASASGGSDTQTAVQAQTNESTFFSDQTNSAFGTSSSSSDGAGSFTTAPSHSHTRSQSSS